MLVSVVLLFIGNALAVAYVSWKFSVTFRDISKRLLAGPSAKNMEEVTAQLNVFRSEINKMWEQNDGRIRSLNIKINKLGENPTAMKDEFEMVDSENGEALSALIPSDVKPEGQSIYDYMADQGGQ